MMIQPIGTSPVSGASLSATSGAFGTPTEQAGAAMTTISSRVAATLVRELGLVDRGTRPGQKAAGGDPYGVEALADQLSAALGGTPADTGRVSRALGGFTSEVAALLAAKPHSSALGLVATLHFDLTDADGRPGTTDTDQAIFAIEAATFRLREDAAW
jgi:hypothetical protein